MNSAIAEDAAARIPPSPGCAPARILIVDDHPLFRRGIVALLAEKRDFTVCGEADDTPSALEAMRHLDPDVALVDISMPGTNGIELVKLMLAERPKLPIIILSMHDESVYALRAMRAGARGYVMKAEAIADVEDAMRKVLDGGRYISQKLSDRLVNKAIQSAENDSGSPVDNLSDRELEVLRLIGKGTGSSGIASALNLSIKTIETHRAHIKKKLGFTYSAELVRFAIEWVAQEEG